MCFCLFAYFGAINRHEGSSEILVYCKGLGSSWELLTIGETKAASTKGQRQQILEAMQGLFPPVGEQDGQVRCEFHKGLTTEAAGRSEGVGFGYHDQGFQFVHFHTLGHGGTQGHSFGADGSSVAGVFHVASGHDGATRGAERRTHKEARVGRMGTFTRTPCGFE
jgi:hypothetical protein